jgi:hypothetical protein
MFQKNPRAVKINNVRQLKPSNDDCNKPEKLSRIQKYLLLFIDSERCFSSVQCLFH